MSLKVSTSLLDEEGSRSGVLSYLLAAMIGLALVLYSFPLDFIFPIPGKELPGGDAGQHIIGQRYFIGEAWGWPLLHVRGLMAPVGINLAFVDGIPLMGLALKLLAPVLPANFHGIGLWYALAWLLQPVAAVFCLRSAGEKRVVPAVAFALLAAAMPAWWNRFGHAALTGHFLLLLALGCYFRLVRPVEHFPWRPWLWVALLLAASLLVHPYLLLMSLAMIAAAPATLLARRLLGQRGTGWMLAILGLGLCLTLLALLTWSLRYTGAKSPGGHGYFSMNMLSPIWPYNAGLLPPEWRPPQVDATGMGGWEGYNWLGFGVVAGLLAGIVTGSRGAARSVLRHSGLVLVCVALFLLSLSFRIGFGSRIILDLGPPPEILQQFRVTGRLFWPVGYLLALGAVLLLARLRRPAVRNLALAAIAAMQWVDAGPTRAWMLAQPPTPAPFLSLPAETLRNLLPKVSALTLLPTWECLPPAETAQLQPVMMQMVAVASERLVPVNTMYLARFSDRSICEADLRAASAPLSPGELRVFVLPGDWRTRVPAGNTCQPVGRMLFCGAPGMMADMPVLVERSYTMASGEAGTGFLMQGWSHPESWGIWSVGPEATLALPPPPPGEEGRRLGLRVMGFGPRAGEQQPVTVLVDGKPVATWMLGDLQASVQWLDTPAAGKVLTFRFADPTSPAARGMSADPRPLAMGLISLQFAP
jgi:hypothetical protein